jgi:mannosyltransferase
VTGPVEAEAGSIGTGAIEPAPVRIRLAVAAIAGVALALGFAHLQRRSLWQDEAFTWSTVDRDFPAFLTVVAGHEGYQILHSLIEWPTNRISSTVDGLRAPSVLAFAAAVPAVWLAGRRLFDERTGLLAALLFSLNGFALAYAQEARGYMLATALCAYSGASLAHYVLAPRGRSRAMWIACSVLTIYAHGFAVLGIGAQIAALWFLPASKRRDLHWIRDGLLIALLAAPAILAPLAQISNGEIGFIAKPGLNEMRGLVWSMAGRTVSSVPALGLGVLVAIAVALSAGRRELHSIDTFRFALPILWMIVPPFVLMAVSYAHPIWLERYAVWSVVAVVILAAFGLTRLGGGNAVIVAAIALLTVGLAVRGVTKWYREPPYQDYHSAMGELAPRLRAGDAVIFSPDEVRLPSEFYLRSAVDLQSLTPVFPTQSWGEFKTGDEHIDPVGQTVIDRVIARRYARLWVVSYSSPGVIVPKLNELRVAYRVVSDREYRGIVEVTLLEAR